MVSDGDSKAYAIIKDLEYKVEKEECLNHVSKRLGTALRKLKSGGRGGLTAILIKRLQRYYANAIRDNKQNLEGMKKSVWAAYYHGISTDDLPQHDHCNENWCFYLKAQYMNVVPAAHDKAVGTKIREDLKDKVKEVYERLTSETLLKLSVIMCSGLIKMDQKKQRPQRFTIHYGRSTSSH